MTTPSDDLPTRVHALEQRLGVLEDALSGISEIESRADPSPDVVALIRRRADATGDVVYAGVVHLPDQRAIDWQYGLTTDTILADDWANHTAQISALAHPVRLKILQAILNGTASVAELTQSDDFGTSGQIYHHINQLVASNWLVSVGRGRFGVPTARIVPLLAVMSIMMTPSS